MASKLIIACSGLEAAKAKNDNSAFLAGGTEINRLNSLVCADELISMKKACDLKKIVVDENTVKIGSMVTFQEIVDSCDVPAYVKEGALNMGARTKRNMATIGGNIAIARDDSYMVPVLMAAQAKLELMDADGNVETVCICKYVKEKETFKNKLIVSVSVRSDRKVLSKRFSNTKESLACVTVAVGADCGKDVSVGIAVKNLGLFFSDEIASKIESGASDEDIKSCVDGICADLKDDFYGSANYKKYLLTVALCDMAKEVK